VRKLFLYSINIQIAEETWILKFKVKNIKLYVLRDATSDLCTN